MSELYDLIVIGGGPAGYVGSIRAAQLGMKVACIEKRPRLGGTCLNIGCIPSKALLDATEHYHQVLHASEGFGITVERVGFDLSKIMQHKNSVVGGLQDGIDFLFQKNKISRFVGTGKVVSKNPTGWTVEVIEKAETKTLNAKRVLLAMGSDVIELPFLKYDGEYIVSSTETLSLTQVPAHLAVVGGGYIGLEMASVWSRLGSRITIIETQSRILAQSDEASAKELQKSLIRQGMEFRFNTFCKGAEIRDGKVFLQVEEQGKVSELKCDKVLVAVGRKPLSQDLGLKEIGIEFDERNRIQVSAHYETTVAGIFAVGDLIAGPMLAHKASEEAVAAVERMAGVAGHVNYNAIPSVIYTWPEYASVGAAEHELKEKNVQYKVGVFPFSANARARSLREKEGLIRILADATTDRVLGVHIVGPRASEMIPAAVTAIEFGGSAEDIARTCFAHPTLPEALKEASLDVDKRRLHL
jgi:dihydrolipoamide dehydrogenase